MIAFVFSAALEEQDYAVLTARQKDKHLSNDAGVQNLLQTLALLQYENGDVWCNVHPVVGKLLEQRKG